MPSPTEPTTTRAGTPADGNQPLPGRRALLAAPLLALLPPAACRRDATADPRGRITLRAGDQMSLVRTQLALGGDLAHAPYAVRWAPFPAGPPLLEALNAGAVDVGAVGGTPAIFAQAAGWPVRVVAAIRNDPSFEAIIAPHGSALRRLSDLRGKKVAVAKGSSAHYLLLAALARVNLGFADIEPVYLTPNDAQPAFENGHLDAWAVWDPFVANNLLQGAVKIADGTGLAEDLGLVVTNAAALVDPARAAAIGDYLQRLKVSQAWAVAHKPLWAAEYVRLTGLGRAVVDDMFTRYQPRYVPMDEALQAAHQKVADAFADARLIPARLRVAEVFDRRFEDGTRAL